jgi:hypothetical protein
MSQIWDALIGIQDGLVQRFESDGHEVFEKGMSQFNKPNWVNRVWTSKNYRRAHVDVVDVRETKGLWMMHCCIFPHLHNNGPIFGLDVIAGKNKITGFFHDYSASVDIEHEMIVNFGEEVDSLEWRKKRDLPDWAKAIFSPHMIAAGNVNNTEEIDQIVEVSYKSIDEYLLSIGKTNNTYDTISVQEAQNRYAYYQKQNPHTPKTMVSLGLSEEDVKTFIQECLFPEIK